MLECMTAKNIREATLEDEHLSALVELALFVWSSTNSEMQENQLQYLYIQRGNNIHSLECCKKKRNNCTCIAARQGTKATTHYPIGNTKTKNAGMRTKKFGQHDSQHRTNKIFPTFLDFHAIQPKDKIMPYGVPGRPFKTVGADIFRNNNKDYLCIGDYHSKIFVI